MPFFLQAEELEKGMHLLGATAIEDKLQVMCGYGWAGECVSVCVCVCVCVFE